MIVGTDKITLTLVRAIWFLELLEERFPVCSAYHAVSEG